MVWVKFLEPFNFTPEAKRTVTIAYRHDKSTAGEFNVTRECAAKAEALGVRFEYLKGRGDGSHDENDRPGQAEGASAADAEDSPAADDGSGEDERENAEGSGGERRPSIDGGIEADDPILRRAGF